MEGGVFFLREGGEVEKVGVVRENIGGCGSGRGWGFYLV